MRKLALLMLFMILNVSVASAEVIKVTNEYLPTSKSRVEAEQAAVQAAMRQAIQQVVGLTIESEFSSEQQENVKNNRHDFEAKIEDKLYTKSSGFIKSYKVISQEWTTINKEKSIKTVLEADVYESKIKATLGELAALYAKAGNILVLIKETYVDAQNKRAPYDSPQLATMLEEQLQKRGFMLVGKQQAVSLVAKSEADFNRLFEGGSELESLAREASADIIMLGTLDIIDKGIISDSSMSALNGQLRIELKGNVRVVQVSTGEVLSSKTVAASSMGINLERAMVRALSGKGNNVVSNIMQVTDGIDQKLKSREKDGTKYVLLLEKVTNYRKVGMVFEQAMAKMVEEGIVLGAKEVSFNSDSKELTMEIQAKQDTKQLINDIFKACDSQNVLNNIDLSNSSGHKIVLTF